MLSVDGGLKHGELKMPGAPKILVTVYHLTAREAPYLLRLERAGFEVVRNPSAGTTRSPS